MPTLLSFVVAASFILFMATRFNLDWDATWENVRSMNLWLYTVGLLLYYVSFWFRGLRWRILAHNTGALQSPDQRLPSTLDSARLIVVGWFVNSIMWLRLGDAYRAYAFAKEARADFSWSLGTILAERVLDIATVLAILLISIVFLTTTSDSSASTIILLAASVMVVVLVAILLLMKMYGSRLAGFLPNRLETSYHKFHHGTLGSFKNLPTLLTLGFIGWVFEIARLYFVIEALGLSVPWPLIPVVALGHALLSTVPTPGGVGAVETGMTGLLLLSLDRHDAVSVAIVDRSITYLSVIVIGGMIFLLTQAMKSKSNRSVSASRVASERGLAE